jgi:Tol biopolymer transport system component
MTLPRGRRAVPGLVVGVALLVAAAWAFGAEPRAQLVSKNSQGDPANDDGSTAIGGALSADGRLVAFSSSATNLPGGSGTFFQTYVHDVETGKTSLMSRKRNGDPADGAAVTGGISADGRFVVFEGGGTGLPGANPNHAEVWVRDRKLGETRLVSKTSGGKPAAGGDSVEPTVSANGRYVVFASEATNFPGGIGGIFVRDMKRSKTIRASRTSGGEGAYGFLCGQSISSDGSRVVFRSDDPDLPGANGYDHIYLRNLDRGRTTLIDRRTDGQVGSGGNADCPSISGNGRFVAFKSYATNLPAVTAPDSQQFLRDTKLGRLILVSRNNAGKPQDGSALYGQPSGDGRYVTFQASATNLPGSSPSYDQAYVRDRKLGTTHLLSRAANGDPADDTSDTVSISRNGHWAAFESPATNLGGDPTHYNVFRAGRIP